MIPGTQKWPFFFASSLRCPPCFTKMPFLGAVFYSGDGGVQPSSFQVWKECDATFHQGEFWDQYGCPGPGCHVEGGPVG